MQKYAVIRIKGKQYRVSEGQELLIDKLGDTDINPEVLLIADSGKLKLGKPVIKDAKVAVKIITQIEKGEKMEVYHFKAKSRYKKHTGFRPRYTRVVVDKIAA